MTVSISHFSRIRSVLDVPTASEAATATWHLSGFGRHYVHALVEIRENHARRGHLLAVCSRIRPRNRCFPSAHSTSEP